MNDILTILQKETKTKTNASALVEALIEAGVDSIFGIPGAAVLSIYNELSQVQIIKHYLVRHEQAAVHAAEGYARISGKAGVVLVTSGPGFTNTITGIANAYSDSTPLVILAGDVPSANKKGKIFQNVNITSIAKTCTKKTIELSKRDDIKEVIKEAFEVASSGVKGPVVIVLPRNILESKYTRKFKLPEKHSSNSQYDENSVNKLSRLINHASQPLILLGGGTINAAGEVKTFVEKLNCPVVSTLMGIGVFPSNHQLYLGMIGINGAYPANTALNQCDLLISLGASFSDRSTCKSSKFAQNAKIVSVNLNSVPMNFELQINTDVRHFLTRFNNSKSGFKTNDEWIAEILSVKDEFSVSDKETTGSLHSSYVLRTLSKYTEKYEPIIVTDVGQHQMLTAQYFNFTKPRKFITSGGMGTMGFGLPAAMGAHIANPDNLILNITGDGSFQMNLQELATCREHNIPIKIIIMNNGYLGMVRQLQEKIYSSQYQVEMTNPDFTKIAEAYDLFAIRVKSQKELIPALCKAINHPGTAIVDIMIDPLENI